MRRIFAPAALFALFLVGCSTVSVTRTVSMPAPIPVNIYPVAYVTTQQAQVQESQQLAQVVAQTIGGRGDVQTQMQAHEVLQSMQGAGQMRETDAVIIVNATPQYWVTQELRQRTRQDCRVQYVSRMTTVNGRTQNTQVQERVCVNVPENYYQPHYYARLSSSVSVLAAVNGAVVQTEQWVSEDDSYFPGNAERAVVENTVQWATTLFRDRQTEVRLAFQKADSNPQVEQALDAIDGGRWADGRTLFEQVIADPGFANVLGEQRAIILFDAALAIGWEPGLEPSLASQRVQQAMQLLDQAAQSHPIEEIGEARAGLDQYRQVLDSTLAIIDERNRRIQATTGGAVSYEAPALQLQAAPESQTAPPAQ